MYPILSWLAAVLDYFYAPVEVAVLALTVYMFDDQDTHARQLLHKDREIAALQSKLYERQRKLQRLHGQLRNMNGIHKRLRLNMTNRRFR